MSGTEWTEVGLGAFTEALASKTSVPGGGGACALAGSLGIALGDMVGEFTVGKKKYAAAEPELRAAMEEAQELRRQLLLCVQKDADAFEPLSKAYSIPRDDPERDAVMEQCLLAAASVPMEVLRLSARAVSVLECFAEKGSVLMISDAAAGAALCRSALQGAAVNIRVNTRLMKDRSTAEKLDKETAEILEAGCASADRIYQGVLDRL